jgi:hypothetical protein
MVHDVIVGAVEVNDHDHVVDHGHGNRSSRPW